MFRFNKDMEYALIALVDMARESEGQLLSARTLSERYNIPFKLLARILQKLSAGGVVQAVKGAQGGYRLVGEAQRVRLRQIIRAVRGDERIADCLGENKTCAQDICGCTIKPFVRIFQDRWVDFVENTTLDEITSLDISTCMPTHKSVETTNRQSR